MNCTVSLSIVKPDGTPLAGVSISARVLGSNTTVSTDSSGVASWTLSDGDKVRFLSANASSLHGLTITIPKTPTLSVGTFVADLATEKELGSGGGGGSYEVATESPATGSNATFTFTGPPTLVFRNGVMEISEGSVAGDTFVFDSTPNLNDVIEGLV